MQELEKRDRKRYKARARKRDERFDPDRPQEPIYPQLTGTLREWVNKHIEIIIGFYLCICLVPILLMGLNSLSLLVIAIFILLTNALYTSIQKQTEDSIGDWSCPGIGRRIILSIIVSYSVFLIVAIFSILYYTTNFSNLFSFSSTTTNQKQNYFQKGSGSVFNGDL